MADGKAVGVDGHILQPALLVVFMIQSDGQGWRIVGLTFHLVDIPVGLQVFQITVARVSAYALHLIVIPKRECIVVAISQNDRMPLALHALQIVSPKVATGITI